MSGDYEFEDVTEDIVDNTEYITEDSSNMFVNILKKPLFVSADTVEGRNDEIEESIELEDEMITVLSDNEYPIPNNTRIVVDTETTQPYQPEPPENSRLRDLNDRNAHAPPRRIEPMVIGRTISKSFSGIIIDLLNKPPESPILDYLYETFTKEDRMVFVSIVIIVVTVFTLLFTVSK
jgi:hypothetical protein